MLLSLEAAGKGYVQDAGLGRTQHFLGTPNPLQQ
jgi:hypothetical protein